MGVLLGLRDVELGPARARERPGERVRLLGRERDLDRQARLVLGHGHHQQVRRGRLPVGSGTVEGIERLVGERVRQLAGPVGPEVHVDDRIADRAPCRRRRRRRWGPRTRRSHRARRPPRSPRPRSVRALRRRRRSRRSHAPFDPTACRGPSPSTVRRRWRSARRGGSPPADARGPARIPGRARSSAGCPVHRAAHGSGPTGRPRRAASSTRASRWRSWAWTPPGPRRPTVCRRPVSSARSQAAISAGRSKKLPSSIAASMRGRSWSTGRPAPRLR